MITGGRTQARDDVFSFVNTLAQAEGIETIWQDELEEKDVDAEVLIVAMQHVSGEEAAISRGLGKQRTQKNGFINVTIRVPVKSGGLTRLDSLTTMVENVFIGRSTPNGVWFRDVIGREVPPKDGNAQATVSAEFIYQEIQDV